MKSKPVVPREVANRDVDEAVEHYLDEGSEKAAAGFIDALERATSTSPAIPRRDHCATRKNSICRDCVPGL